MIFHTPFSGWNPNFQNFRKEGKTRKNIWQGNQKGENFSGKKDGEPHKLLPESDKNLILGHPK